MKKKDDSLISKDHWLYEEYLAWLECDPCYIDKCGHHSDEFFCDPHDKECGCFDHGE